jgi:hypothetical protein
MANSLGLALASSAEADLIRGIVWCQVCEVTRERYQVKVQDSVAALLYQGGLQLQLVQFVVSVTWRTWLCKTLLPIGQRWMRWSGTNVLEQRVQAAIWLAAEVRS